MVVVASGLTGCSPAHQSALTLDADSGNPQYVTALCDGEGIVSVRLEEADEDGFGLGPASVLWAIEAATPQPVESVIVGEVPDGFTETTALPDGPLPASLLLTADHDGGAASMHDSSFAPGDLEPGVLLQHGHEVDMDQLEDSARGNCGGLLGLLGLPPWTGWAILGVVLAIVGGLVVLLVWLIRQGRRARRAHATPPPWPSR